MMDYRPEWYERGCSGPCAQGRFACKTPDACALHEADELASARGIVVWCGIGLLVLAPIAALVWYYFG